MHKYVSLVCVCLLLIIGMVTGCREEQVMFDQLFSNPNQYNRKYLTIEGFFFGGFEVIVLSENLEYSGYAEGHLVPKGRMVWIEGGIPREVYDALYQQQMMGPMERYGKVRLKGKFEHGAKYGHLGGYSSQVIYYRSE